MAPYVGPRIVVRDNAQRSNAPCSSSMAKRHDVVPDSSHSSASSEFWLTTRRTARRARSVKRASEPGAGAGDPVPRLLVIGLFAPGMPVDPDHRFGCRDGPRPLRCLEIVRTVCSHGNGGSDHDGRRVRSPRPRPRTLDPSRRRRRCRTHRYPKHPWLEMLRGLCANSDQLPARFHSRARAVPRLSSFAARWGRSHDRLASSEPGVAADAGTIRRDATERPFGSNERKISRRP